MQHPRRIANTAGVHGHIDNLLLDLGRLTGVGIVEEKGPSTPLEAGPAPIALLPFRRQTMLDNIGPLAIGAVQHLRNPTATLGCVAQNCPHRITILPSPATRETAFDVLINPCDRGIGSRSVAVGIKSGHSVTYPAI